MKWAVIYTVGSNELIVMFDTIDQAMDYARLQIKLGTKNVCISMENAL